MPLDELQRLLDSPWHEARLCALLVLVYRFQDKKTPEAEREKMYRFYLKNTRRCNNWDLVDLSCRDIVGEYLVNRDRSVLYELAASDNLWEQRISIVCTWAFIRRSDFTDTLALAERLMTHKQKRSGYPHRLSGTLCDTASAYGSSLCHRALSRRPAPVFLKDEVRDGRTTESEIEGMGRDL